MDEKTFFTGKHADGTPVNHGSHRQKLPNRRDNEGFTVEWARKNWSFCIGFDPVTGKPLEVFADGAKIGSDYQAVIDDACVLLSHCLQNGMTPRQLSDALSRESIEPGAPAASLLGLITDVIHKVSRDGVDRRIPEGGTGVIAALFVETGGCYFGIEGVDPWGEARDARLYDGPDPVVAHPPCQRWGRFHHGSTRKPHQYALGDDKGCFQSALASVRRCGGILEHPADSKAWLYFGIDRPVRGGGWLRCTEIEGWTCYVEQGNYGHAARKGTWLYAAGVDLPELDWSIGEQRLHPRAVELHGYEKARRIGMMAMIGGKDRTRLRNATPLPFRDLLIGIAATAR